MSEHQQPQFATQGAAAQFHRLYEQNMRLSTRMRIAAMLVLVLVGLGWLVAFASPPADAAAMLLRLVLAAAVSVPFLLLWWMLQRWGFEAKTLAYGFQRKAIVEERLFDYAQGDEALRKRLMTICLVHWMEKSPLEVMLAIGGKSKGMGGGASPTASVAGKPAGGDKP